MISTSATRPGVGGVRVIIALVVALLMGGAQRPKGAQGAAYQYPANEYEYSLKREWLLEAEQQFSQSNGQALSSDERIVDQYLHYLKWREFTSSRVNGFPPSRPIEQKLDYIRSTEIYARLKTLPKGGNMHSHEEHELSRLTLLDIVYNSSDFKYFYLRSPDHPTLAWSMDFFAIPPPSDGTPPWIRVQDSNFTKEEIAVQQTMMGLMTVNASNYPTDSEWRWNIINPLWGRGSVNLISNINIKSKYIQAMYDHSFSEGVTYFESRLNFGSAEWMYYLDPDPQYNATNGKVYIGNTWQESSDRQVMLAMELAANMTAAHPEFIGHKRISYTYRQNPFDVWNAEMENVDRLYHLYPQHVVGFDIVGEEEAGYSHLYYLQNFLLLYNNMSQQSDMPLYLHSSETNYPEDLIASMLPDDPVATLQNAYEVLLLGTKRIGHGAGFIKHPYLLEVIRQRGIAIESCLVSNQLLGFVADLRNHPGLHYYRSGIPIMFGADDPGTFGYDDFTVDWYEAFMGWGLTLLDLKTIAVNSLNYSALFPDEKKYAIENQWTPTWIAYVAAMKALACSRDYIAEGAAENRAVYFNRLLPQAGSRAAGTNVHVFGKNFERGICQKITCLFGSVAATQAVYVTNEHLICVSPDLGVTAGSQLSVNITVQFGDGQPMPTNLVFTYKYDVITTTVPPNTSDCMRQGGISLGFFGSALVATVMAVYPW